MNQYRGISIIEQKDELSRVILTECLITALTAFGHLFDAESVKKATRPYFENSGRAWAINLDSLVNRDEDLVKIANLYGLGFYSIGVTKFSGRISNSQWIGEVEDCPYANRAPCICYGICEIVSECIANSIKPGFIHSVHPAMNEKDNKCRFELVYPDLKEEGSELEPMDPQQVLGRLEVGDLIRLSNHTISELWNIVIRAMLDSLETYEIESLIDPLAKECGALLAPKLLSDIDDKEGSGTASLLIKRLNDALDQECDVSTNKNDDVEGEVTACPFSDSPVQVCLQFESFCQGLCGALDPNCEFVYEKMMTKGDRTCHWVVRNKKGTSSITDRCQNPLQTDPYEPLTLLKLRYVRGEISEEEFRRMKKVLLE